MSQHPMTSAIATPFCDNTFELLWKQKKDFFKNADGTDSD